MPIKDPSKSGESTTEGSPGKTNFYKLFNYKKTNQFNNDSL